MTQVQSGIDRLLADPPVWLHSRIALVTNHAASTARFVPSRQALLTAGFKLVKLFSPEHGLDTTGADGHEMHSGIDPLTRLPVISLYGNKLAPSAADLADVDLVLFDVPDVGCRFYTYLWTMTYVMESCLAHGRKLVIADRPNPISGRLDLAEGPSLDESACSSFIGRWEMPVRHSCTLGELANYFKAVRKMDFPLEVITCRNWDRSLFYPDWACSFVPTSPAITGFESALLYPGLGLLEATNISEGRGTATPFRVAGAPWMDGVGIANRFNSAHPAGVYARPVSFTPVEGKYAGQKCMGLMLHVSDPTIFRPVLTGWSLIGIIRELHPDTFEWAPYPTYVNSTGKKHLDLLTGLPGSELKDISRYLSTDGWMSRMGPYLLH